MSVSLSSRETQHPVETQGWAWMKGAGFGTGSFKRHLCKACGVGRWETFCSVQRSPRRDSIVSTDRVGQGSGMPRAQRVGQKLDLGSKDVGKW